MDSIAGRVTGPRPGQQIVIYARSRTWWVQPRPDRPIHADSTWSTETHLGPECAVMLVAPDYRPASTTDTAPTAGGPAVLVKIAKGTGTPQFAPTKALHFSGYDRSVGTIASDRGGKNNLYSANNAWTDATGVLHLHITKQQGRWSCAHVDLNRSLGYGTYRLVVGDSSHLEPAAVFSLTTFDQWGNNQHFREMEVEISRWGDPANYNAQYGIQPFYVSGNVSPFKAPPGTLTHFMRCESGRATFKTVRGESSVAKVPWLLSITSTRGCPRRVKKESNSFSTRWRPIRPLKKGGEVVVEKFEYLP